MSDQQTDADDSSSLPAPMEYHLELRAYLRSAHADAWKWFASHPVRTQHTESVRLALLRSTYRIEREANASLYEVVDAVAAKMNIRVPVTVFQADSSQGYNASLAWLPDEVQIVLYGDVQNLLIKPELEALIAHELAHHELYALDDAAFLIVEQLLSAMLADQSTQAPHDRTWRSFRLYTELYCDRRALDASENLDNVICALIKLKTGLKEVSAAAYLSQAEEILSRGDVETDEVTHPEMFIRAKALATWYDNPNDASNVIRPLIEGPLKLSELDLLRQAKLTQLTRHFVQDFLQPKWLQTRVTLGHMRRLFADFSWDQTPPPPGYEQEFTSPDSETDPQLLRYLCFLLLDFVTVDPELEDAPLAAALLFADRHQFSELFEAVAVEELRPGKRHFQRLRKQAKEIVVAAEKEFAE